MDVAAAARAAPPCMRRDRVGRRLRRRHSIATLASSDGGGSQNEAVSSNERAGGNGSQTEDAVPVLYIKGLKKNNDVVRQEDVEKVVRSARTARGEGGAEEETEQILGEEQEGFDWDRVSVREPPTLRGRSGVDPHSAGGTGHIRSRRTCSKSSPTSAVRQRRSVHR